MAVKDSLTGNLTGVHSDIEAFYRGIGFKNVPLNHANELIAGLGLLIRNVKPVGGMTDRNY